VTDARQPTAQEAALAALRQAIVTRELLPGEQVVQERLSTRFGVSRVPLREALKVLEGEGQVVYSPHRGYFVADLSLDDLVEAYRIRDLLESEAVRVGVPTMTAGQVREVAALAERWDEAAKADDLAAMTTTNRDFHFALIAACAMPRLIRMIRVLWDATDAYRAAYYVESGSRTAVTREHRTIVAAVRRRDADAVVVRLREHREAAVARLSQVLSGGPLSG
jgi:DNA-binding GntR family transcriptional regulator